MPAAELGAQIIKALLARSGVKPEQISEVIMGQVLTAGVGQNPARQALIRAGLPGPHTGHDHQQGVRQRPEGHASRGAGDQAAATRTS